jgi:hypothetical protein
MPQQQATGTSPASTPSPNRGLEAVALAALKVHVEAINRLSGFFPAGSDAWRDVHKAVELITKHVPPGAVSQGLANTQAEKMAMQQRQMAPQIAAMRAAQSQQQQPAQPGAAGPQPMAA